MSGVALYRTEQMRILLLKAPMSYAELGVAMKLKPPMVRRYLAALAQTGLRVRVAEWRMNANRAYDAYIEISNKADAKKSDHRTVSDAEVETAISRENTKKAARITPRRDPMTTMLFGPHIPCD